MLVRLSSLATLVALATVGAACASRNAPASLPDTPSSHRSAVETLPDPAALIRRGCFTCLERAFAAAQRQNLPHLAFEAAALLALRSKELGILPDDWLDRARTLSATEASRQFVQVVEALPDDPLSGSRDDVLPEARQRLRATASSPQWIDAVTNGPGSPEFRSYLQTALTCALDNDVTKPRADVAASIPESVREAPLLRYRLGVCGREYASVLLALRAADGGDREFVDADFALGRYALQQRPYPDPDEALRLFRSAAGAFPRSPAIATAVGDTFRIIEAWDDALAAYTIALALVPNHPDALIGRTVALSNANRYEAAIETATRVIDRGRWFVGQALYWRAWNHFQLGSDSTARADADRARGLLVTPNVHLLSGLIDWRLRRLVTAERDFEETLRMDAGQCEAAMFLGEVRNEQSNRRGALEVLQDAVRCYAGVVTHRRQAIAGLEAARDAPALYKAREIARHERAIEQAERRRIEAEAVVEALLKDQPPR